MAHLDAPLKEMDREQTNAAAIFMANRDRLALFLRARADHSQDSSDVEDLIQELWLRWSRIDLDGIDDPRSYLFRMGHNLIIDRARRAARARTGDADWSYVNGLDGTATETVCAEQRLLARERLATIHKAIQAAGERVAWVFRRYRLDGVDQQRIARELNISLSTVERDLSKAYAVLSALKRQSDEG